MTPKKVREIDKGLRLELDRFPRKKVKAFIRSVHTAIYAHEEFQTRSETQRRDKLRKLKAAAETYLGTGFQSVQADPYRLRVDKALRFDPDRVIIVPGLTSWPVRRAQPKRQIAPRQLYRARDRARAAVTEYVRQIEGSLALAEHQKKLRAADATGLLARIADRYAEIFGEQPVTTPGGTFSNLAARILGQDDVSREVRAALTARRHSQKP
jgi:hypothetical protein